MKNNITKKFNSRCGASIMIALVIFLLCALAGASAFIMAASNAGRYSHKNEQEYYSVSSAALMIVDMLDELKYTSYNVKYEYERQWSYEEGEHGGTDSYKLTIPDLNSETDSEKDNRMSNATTIRVTSKLDLCREIRKQCDLLVPYLYVPNEWYLMAKAHPYGEEPPTEKPENAPASISYKFNITVEDKSGNQDTTFGKVDCELVMNANCDLIFIFSSENSNEEESKEYSISVYWKAEVNSVPTAEKPVYKYVDLDANGHYTTGSLTEEHNLKVTVQWNKENVTISRGEAVGK